LSCNDYSAKSQTLVYFVCLEYGRNKEYNDKNIQYAMFYRNGEDISIKPYMEKFKAEDCKFDFDDGSECNYFN
jgi:hypothetical protein